jgi:tetratricopeptide (TPR) repeat protein
MRLLQIFSILLILAMIVGLSHNIEVAFTKTEAEAHFLYLPSSNYLEVTSLGFKTLLADIIYLWSIQYYGEYLKPRRFDYVWHIYDVITDLDPKFKDAYYLGSHIMCEDIEDRDMAILLLKKGIKNNPEEWFFLFEMGFLRYEERRYEEASEYFGRAMALPNAGEPVRRLYAAMLTKAGHYDAARKMWLQIYFNPKHIWEKNISARYLFGIKVNEDKEIIQRALSAYRAQKGVNPPSIKKLVFEKYLTSEPLDPYEKPYIYNPKTGEIICQSQYRFLKPPVQYISTQ